MNTTAKNLTDARKQIIASILKQEGIPVDVPAKMPITGILDGDGVVRFYYSDATLVTFQGLEPGSTKALAREIERKLEQHNEEVCREALGDEVAKKLADGRYEYEHWISSELLEFSDIKIVSRFKFYPPDHSVGDFQLEAYRFAQILAHEAENFVRNACKFFERIVIKPRHAA